MVKVGTLVILQEPEEDSPTMRSLATLPNQEGFQFTGALRTGETRVCTVIKNPDGCCTVEGYEDLIGWYLPSRNP